MTDKADITAEKRRLAILTELRNDSNYRINDAMLQEFLRPYGLDASLAQIRADMAWLEQTGLISVQQTVVCHVALLRPLGLDVANGDAGVPGVAKPLPV